MSQIVEVMPGKMYAVECSSPVTVMNVLTGTVVAQGDGSAQVFFVACADAYEISSDSAIVTVVFKLAPRLKLTLLQGVAGGWLPSGYTALDYLESSGTQYIDTGVYLSNLHNVSLTMQQGAKNGSNGAGFGSQDAGNASAYGWSVYGLQSGYFGWFFYGTLSTVVLPEQVPGYTKFDVLHVEVADGRLKINGLLLPFSAEGGAFTARKSCWVFARNSDRQPNNLTGRIFSFEITGAKRMKLIPALRNADRVPGMWDTVSKQFFINAGSGTFGYRIKATGVEVAPTSSTYSLRAARDPYYVAPSGVWARPAGVNGLEFVADTEEVDGDAWLHFANTAEAEEHFGITQEEILTE